MSKPGFFTLNLLGELSAQLFLLLLELGVLKSLDFWFAKLACLHLLLPVVFVVELLRCRDQV